MDHHHARLLKALRATVAEIEDPSKFHPEDPSLGDLKKILLRRIASLEVEETEAGLGSPDGSGILD